LLDENKTVTVEPRTEAHGFYQYKQVLSNFS